jgi:branched-chain amino acid transport system ATP-binding protein
MLLLDVRNLTKYYGGLAAVMDLSFTMGAGEIVGLIGPNGAGKTTVFNMLSGFCRPTLGRVIFRGRDVVGLKPYQIAKLGLVRTFQANTLFSEKTVFDNVMIAQHLRRGRRLSLVNVTAEREASENHRRGLEVLELLGLAEMRGELAGNLAHGFQRALGIAMALSADPALILLDEPLAGMSREEIERVLEPIINMRNLGISVLLVEHNMNAVLDICERIVVLNFGEKIAEDGPERIVTNRDVIDSYLGSEEI